MPELRRELRHRPLDLEDALLDVARDVHRPAAVAKVALELAEDRGDGEGREGGAPGGVEAVACLHEADTRHLDEIVEGLGAARVARGQAPGEGHESPEMRPARSGWA